MQEEAFRKENAEEEMIVTATYEVAMHGPLLGEFMRTMVLVLSGDGVVANALRRKSKGEGAGCFAHPSPSSS